GARDAELAHQARLRGRQAEPLASLAQVVVVELAARAEHAYPAARAHGDVALVAHRLAVTAPPRAIYRRALQQQFVGPCFGDEEIERRAAHADLPGGRIDDVLALGRVAGDEAEGAAQRAHRELARRAV